MTTSCADTLETLPFPVMAILASLNIAEAIIASTLNALLIVLFCRFRTLLTKRNALLLSLAIADLLIGLVAAPAQAALLITSNELSSRCVAAQASKYTKPLITVTGFVITSIAVDRYFYVKNGRTYDAKMKTWRFGLFLGAPWFMPVILTLSVAATKHLSMWTILIMNASCVVVQCSCHAKLSKFLRKRRLQGSSVQAKQGSGVRTTSKATKMILKISVLHIICTAPFLIYRIVYTSCYYMKHNLPWLQEHEDLVKVVVFFAFQTNSCSNPALYFGMSKELRDAARVLREQMCVKKRSKIQRRLRTCTLYSDA